MTILFGVIALLALILALVEFWTARSLLRSNRLLRKSNSELMKELAAVKWDARRAHEWIAQVSGRRYEEGA